MEPIVQGHAADAEVAGGPLTVVVVAFQGRKNPIEFGLFADLFRDGRGARDDGFRSLLSIGARRRKQDIGQVFGQNLLAGTEGGGARSMTLRSWRMLPGQL